MRILHLITSAGRGGAENHLLKLVRHQIQRGHDVEVAYLKEAPSDPAGYISELRATGSRVTHVANGRILRRALAFRRLVKRLAPDVVHSHLPRADLVVFIALRLIRGRRTPHVISVHNRFAVYHKPLVRQTVRTVYGSADAIIAISGAVRAELVELRIRSDHVFVIYYGLDRSSTSPDFPDPTAVPDVRPSGRPLVGTVARLTKQKGLDVLIAAAALIPERVDVVIAGDDEGVKSALQAKAKELAIESQVQFLGFRTDASELIAQFDVFCLPSRWEGFGLVLLEAGLAGVPVVATNIAPINEIILDEETGLLVQPDDAHALSVALRRVITNAELAGRLAKAHEARTLTEFSVARMVEAVDDVYRNITERKSQGWG